MTTSLPSLVKHFLTRLQLSSGVTTWWDARSIAVSSAVVVISGVILYYSRSSIPRLDTNLRDKLIAAADTDTKPRPNLTNSTSAQITLQDGRKLGYAQYGSSTGRPVFALHGLPGSRIDYATWDELATNVNVRILATDCPGIGWSSPHPGRTLLDHAKDIKELAEHLKLEDYGVLGISGGGPYALACAYALPSDRLKAVSVVCGLGLPDMDDNKPAWRLRLAFKIVCCYMPALVRWWLSRQTFARLDLPDEQRFELLRDEFCTSSPSSKDAEAFTRFPQGLQVFTRSCRETFGQGFDGVSQEAALVCKDFGFRLEDVRKDLPVHLWYGLQDKVMPVYYGEMMAGRLGSNARLYIKDDTHGSLQGNWQKEILQDLVKSMK